MWNPQSFEGQFRAGQHHEAFDPRRGAQQAVPFGTRPSGPAHGHPTNVHPGPAHVQHGHAPQAYPVGAPQLRAALPNTPHMVPQPDIPPVEERASLMDRFKRRASEDTSVPTKGNRKPFLLGVLTGVVVTLLVGQLFSAATPAPDYSYAPAPALQETPDSETEADPESAVAFLDRVEGLD